MKINELPIGTIIIDEQSLYNKKPIEWIIIDKNHSGYPNKSVTLLTKDTIPVPDGYILKLSYEKSNIRQWLNEIFFNTLSKNMQRNILLTDIISDKDIIKDKLFLLSATEVCCDEESKIEGVPFDYFKNEENRAANENWWSRTEYSMWFRKVNYTGKFDYGYFDNAYGQLRIACNVKANVNINEDNVLFNNTKFLIKQNNNYYAIKSNFYNLGNPKNIEQLKEWYEKHGINDLNEILKIITDKEISMYKLNENTFITNYAIDFHDINDNIEYIEKDDIKKIKYSCDNYSIYNKLINQFEITTMEVE